MADLQPLGPPLKRVLIIDDSATVVKFLRRLIEAEPGYQCEAAESLEKARVALASTESPVFAAIVDLNLPDAPNGEALDLVLEGGIPAIVLSGSFDECDREQFLEKPIVDYVVKENRYSFEYAAWLVRRLDRNAAIKVLVVDDSRTSRMHIRQLLQRHRFEVVEAADGQEALALMREHPEIRLVITDFTMPKLDGCGLIKELRKTHGQDELIIIGLSSKGSGELSARFLKNGANDFLSKPFLPEEFYCRVMHGIELLEHLETLNDLANRDSLTNVFTRQHWFEVGLELIEDAKKDGRSLAVAEVAVDSLGEINESKGHEAGDQSLQHLGDLLMERFSDATVARTGGGTFALILPDAAAAGELETLSKDEEALRIDGDIELRISTGFTTDMSGSLYAVLKRAGRARKEA